MKLPRTKTQCRPQEGTRNARRLILFTQNIQYGKAERDCVGVAEEAEYPRSLWGAKDQIEIALK